MKRKRLLSILIGCFCFGAVTFIAWMSGYDFHRSSDGGLWAGFSLLAFGCGVAFTRLAMEELP